MTLKQNDCHRHNATFTMCVAIEHPDTMKFTNLQNGDTNRLGCLKIGVAIWVRTVSRRTGQQTTTIVNALLRLIA